MPEIILATLNARYIHSAFGLRYLMANMGELRNTTAIAEFSLESWPADVAETLLSQRPGIIGFGLYIWNIEQTTRIVRLIKAARPEVTIVLGGPEISFEWENEAISEDCDYIVTGEGDLAFPALCRRILNGQPPADRVIAGGCPPLNQVRMPYAEYTEEDIRQRILYVEASRGCPFRCEFCLSALDKTARPFPLVRFLGELARLYDRGARQFKFVDRTFNLNTDTGAAILDFFLDRLDEGLFLHFEVIPDRLPSRLRERLARFPPGTVQLEIGVQTFNPGVQTLISRRQDDALTEQNIRWLRSCTGAHLHTDLIAGLPGEDLASFGAGFDRLIALGPHEIQVGLLKRLKGAPIARHSEAYALRFNPSPPYALLSSNLIDFFQMQRMTRFARLWDLIGNSGRFRNTLPLILGEAPFDRFMALSDALSEAAGRVHGIALKRLFSLVYRCLTENLAVPEREAAAALRLDHRASGLKGGPPFMASSEAAEGSKTTRDPRRPGNRRQTAHR